MNWGHLHRIGRNRAYLYGQLPQVESLPITAITTKYYTFYAGQCKSRNEFSPPFLWRSLVTFPEIAKKTGAQGAAFIRQLKRRDEAVTPFFICRIVAKRRKETALFGIQEKGTHIRIKNV